MMRAPLTVNLSLPRVSIVVAAWCAVAAGAAQPLLDTSMRGFPLGGEASGHYFVSPEGRAAADFDGDGDLDMAYANDAVYIPPDTPVLGVVMNNGDGTFADPVLYPGPVGPTLSLAAADLDGDGDVDLALGQGPLSGGGENVLILLNDGAGSFSAGGVFACGPTPRDIVAADFDGDGDQDLATSASENQIGRGRLISVLFNDGDAGFSRRVDLPTGDIPYWIAAGDLNLDGAADIVYSYWGFNDFGVILSDGSGGFLPHARYAAPGKAQTDDRVAVGDMDGDGLQDVVFGEYEQIGVPSAVGVFRNLGGGSLDAGTPVGTVASRDPLALDIADIDGDGRLDMAFSADDLVEDGWGYVSGNGDGTFGDARFFTTGGVVDEVLIADVSGDGRPDALVMADHGLMRGSASLNVHAQEAGGGFVLPALTLVDGSTRRLDVADIDLDGDLDVVTARSTAFVSLLNNGDGSFTRVREARQLSCMEAVRLADISGDGYPDLLMVKDRSCPPYDFYTAINDGDGTFGQVSAWFLGSGGDNEIAPLDYDNDGDLDVVVSESLAGGDAFVLLFRLDNNGDGTFAPVRRLLPSNHESARRVEGADINADGNMDVIGSAAGDGVIVFLGDGAGEFPSVERYANVPLAEGSGVSWVMPSDMNDDGHMDVAWAGTVRLGDFNETLPAVGVMLGDGSGALVDGGYQLGPDGSDIEMYGIDVVDLDGDGALDVISSGQTSAEVVAFRGVGDGALHPGERYGIDTSAGQPHTGDFDSDGASDVVVVGARMEGAFASMVRNVAAGGCAADFNGDGAVDTRDVLAFLNTWNAQGDGSDFNGDGAIDTRDVLAFLNAWNTGC